MPRCSIVIRCHNEEQHIGKLLSGIMQQTVRDVEVVLVDSGSTDATLAIASRYPVKIVHIRKEDFSFGRSLNMGCAAATAPLIVIASAHVYPLSVDWIEKMLRPFEDPKVALVYGKQRGNEVTKYSEHQVFARWFPEVSNERQTHPFCNNANSAIRKTLWEKFPYDEELTGLEDLAWAKAVLDAGFHLVYVADAPIVHVHDETPGRLFNRYRREAIALKKIFPEERFHLLDFVRLFIANVFSDYFHATHDGVLWKNLRAIPTFRLMQFWGTFRGFATQGAVVSTLKQTFYYPNERVKRTAAGDDAEKEKLIDYSEHGSEANP